MARRVESRFPRSRAPPDCARADARFGRHRSDDRPTLLSINRFEGKKDITLAVEAFARLRASGDGKYANVRLVCAGGYDPRLGDNVRTLASLQQVADRFGLSQFTYSTNDISNVASPVPARFRPSISAKVPDDAAPVRSPDVLFLLNMSAAQKQLLLSSTKTVALLYTPMYEHFGIVPLEAMASGIPVLATETGGPTETIVDRGLPSEASSSCETTGLLRPRDPTAWSQALADLVSLPEPQRHLVAEAGRRRVRDQFSLDRLGRDFELACRDAAGIGYPIPYEAGYKKMVAFFAIAIITLAFGIGAFVLGMER